MEGDSYIKTATAAMAAAPAHAPLFALYDLPAVPMRPPPVAVTEGVEVGVAVGVADAENSPNVADDAPSLTLPMLVQKPSVLVAAAVAADANETAALVELFASLV